jgi:hypothetical protein
MLDAEVCEEFDDIVEVLLVSDCDDSEWVSSNLVSATPDVLSSKSVSLYLSTVSNAGPVSKREAFREHQIYTHQTEVFLSTLAIAASPWP